MENIDRNKKLPRILYLPRWYPSELDPQLGVFIAKHAYALQGFADVAVLYAVPDPGHQGKYRLESRDDHGVKTVIVYYRPVSAATPLRELKASLRYLSASWRGWRNLRKTWRKPDLIHAHVLLRPVFLAAVLSMLYRLPYVVTEHWTGFTFGFFDKKPGWYKWISRKLVKKATCLTVVSESLRDAMLTNGFRNSCIAVVPNVVEVDGPCEERSIGKEKTIMLTVADLVERNKNVSGIIRALHTLVKNGEDIEYHIIGGGEDQEMLRQLAASLGLLNKQVFFHGRKDNAYVLQFIRKADFLVTNSYVETFSVATAEAIACGKPVIATICGGPEFFVDERNGVLIEPGNQAQLEDAIRYMLAHYSDYDRRTLRQSIDERFSAATVAQQLLAIYKTCLPVSEDV